MPGPLEAAGVAHEPSQYAPLSMDRYITGLWTQRSPLRDAAVPYMYIKFYQASRFDSLIDGLNREITAKLTFQRRPGHTIFNANLFPPIRSFFSYKYIQNGVQQVRVLADTPTEVYDATPPGKVSLFTKEPSAGPTRFLGVGNQLFMADGADLKKLQAPNQIWLPNTEYDAGSSIIDSNGNLQYVMPNSPATATISQLQILASTGGGGSTSYLLVLTFAATAPTWAPDTPVKFAGLTGTTELNGESLTPTTGTQTQFGFTPAGNQTGFLYYRGPQAVAAETGTVSGSSSDAGTSGPTEPNPWATTPGGTTPDGSGTLVWTCMGLPIQNWSLAGPTTAPTLVAVPADRYWQALKNLGLWYSILDIAQNLEVITANGTSGSTSVSPTIATSTASATQTGSGTQTVNGTPASGFPSTPVTGSVTIQLNISGSFNYFQGGGAALFEYSLDSGTTWRSAFYSQNTPGGTSNNFGFSAPSTIAVIAGLANLNTLQVRAVATASAGGGGNSTISATLTNLVALVSAAGTAPGAVTGTGQPPWASVLGGSTQDGAFTWINCGDVGLSWGPSELVTKYQAILDTNQNLQIALAVVAPGNSGATTPVWATSLGATTADNNVTWTNVGPGVVLVSGDMSYAYSWHCVDGSITTASPAVTIPNGVLGPPNGYSVTLTGTFPADTQCDQVYIWRTDQGGSSLVYRASIPNPTPGTVSTWTWTDTDPTSAALNPLLLAPLNAVGANNPPPSTATAPEYHLQRVWMINGSQVIWSGGPDTIVGNGNTAFPGINVMQFPEQLTRLISSVTNDATLIVHGTANVYAILGSGTADSPFYPIVYMKNLGVLNYDAIAVVGSTFYIFTNNRKGAEMDPGAGYVEFGFPIGDQFKQMSSGNQTGALFDPKSTYVTWHEKESGDTGLYVADGAVGWFRYSPVAPPESGFLWSPFAAIVGGTSAVQSIEVATGVWELLVGPPGTSTIDITGIQIVVENSHGILIATITLTLAEPLGSPPGDITLNGLTTVPALNGQTFLPSGITGNQVILEQSNTSLTPIGPTTETGYIEFAPTPSGPILKRDFSVFTDNGQTYGVGNCFGTLGNVVLCQSGEIAEVAHVELTSTLVGLRPQVGMLYGEIRETATIEFDMLDYTSVDPPTLAEPESLYSDRYVTSQDGVCPKCVHCQILISWPDQPDGDELLSHTLYGAKYAERKEQPG